MTSSLIVTGVDGFVGRHVARLAAEAGLSVYGISRAARPDTSITEYLHDYASADLRSQWPQGMPIDAPVIHLAGLAAVGASFDAPQEYLSGNSAMVTNLCEWRLAHGSGARVVGVSTGAVYASRSESSLHDEQSAVAFTSPYVVSKILVENQFTYYRSRGLSTVVARPFNHIGPGQGLGFLVPDLIERLRHLPPGADLLVGNLDSRRDYTDVRDVAQAYVKLALAPTLDSSVYNVASGTTRSGRELLNLICIELGRPQPDLHVDESRLRPNDPQSIAGDAALLAAALGWMPTVPITQTIRDAVRA